MPVDYSQREKSFELYRKGKREGTWDPDDFEFEQDKRDWAAFSDTEQALFLTIASGFYEGEEDVTRTLSPYMYALDSLDHDAVPFDPVQEEIFLSQQVYEEAKHTDFFSRYFDEVFDTQDTDYGDFGGDNFWNPELQAYLIDDLEHVSGELRDAAGRAETAAREGGDIEAAQRDLRYKLGDAVMHYMGMVEAQLAETGYSALNQMLGNKDGMPAFQAAMTKIQKDEARHINNGRWLMKKLAQEDPDIVPEVYEPHVRHFEEELSGPTIQNLYVPNPLDIDMQLLVDESLNYMQSHFEIIGEEKFSEEFRADYIDIGDAELQARILEQIQAAA